MPQSWFSITNKGSDTAEIDIFDEIGAWGVTARDFVSQLRNVGPVGRIKLNINSPGGDCNEGFTIYDAIKSRAATNTIVTAHISGLAASMASVIMLAADEITIAENGRVMIHRVTAGVGGNADDIEAVAKVSRQMEDRIVGLYVERTGKDEAVIRDWMKASMGTWFFGKDAIEAGFADAVIKGTKASAFKPEWAGMFTMLPAALFDTKRISNPETSNSMTEAELTAAQEKLAADQAKLAADQKALTDLAAEQTAKTTNLDTATAKVEGFVAQFDALTKRLEAAEALVKSGVAASAGGRSAVNLGNGAGDEDSEQVKLGKAYNSAEPAERSALLKKHGTAAIIAACKAVPAK